MKKFALPIMLALTVLLVGCSSQTIDDSAITAKIKTKLAADGETSATKIGVETNAGIVKLTGTVPNDGEKQKAEQIAKNTDGVKRVVNDIAVNAQEAQSGGISDKAAEAAKDIGAAASDTAILAQVKAKLLADGISGTNVDVSQGMVVLKGEVDDAKKKQKAEELARATNGVKEVSNMLTVKRYKSS